VIRVALRHHTRYRYDRWATLSPQRIRLRPAPHCRTAIASYSLRLDPAEHFVNWQQDPHGNFVARAVFPKPVQFLDIQVDLVAEIAVSNPFDFFLEPEADLFPFVYEPALATELRPFLELTSDEPELDRWVATVDRAARPTVSFLVELNQRAAREIRYEIRLEPGVQTPSHTLARAAGSCRDSAWLIVQALRRLGLASRFVSGYLIQLRADEKPLDGPAGPSADFTDLHAWAEVYLPGAGWVGLDPTSGLLAGEGHIPLAATPSPGAASPVSGAVSECEVAFDFEMSVQRLHEDPRVTLPYGDAAWTRIDALGERVDEALVDGDVRLTLGGEPTFVSVDDRDGEEWGPSALGPTKRAIAERLLARIRARTAPGGLLHFGQGKWYPGESLPRWSLTCYWRRDGAPIWRDVALAATPSANLGHTSDDAQRFAEALAARLGVEPGHAQPAYEDPAHFLREEGRLPLNVEPTDSRLEDPEARERLRRVFERGLGHPVGSVLPLRRTVGAHGPTWQSGLWMLRGRHLVLAPGDSPVGLRLPLASLPWQDPDDESWVEALDPMAPRRPLPLYPDPARRVLVNAPVRALAARQRVHGQRLEDPDRKPAPGESAPWVIRTALAVEAREGVLHAFLPPLEDAEDFLELIAAIEATALALALPIAIEGYPPPADPRLDRLSVTPDPGVIEVNVRPVASWRELVREVEALYADARECRLGAEKFMLDGRHTGTGGGNHVVLGGPTAADSPILRRPDLLRSLLAYWLNHPALSYLFSGLFVGPTSQAPRVDEARDDAVYELELAFTQIPSPGGGECPPWLVDRIFRNLLADVTGNTHRTEFCIDKLYAPESASGRLGLLELRAFETPPHPRMSLVQQLLLRALVAWFWREPYGQPPQRWGTQLHDRFLLPHYVDQDLCGVLADLTRAGFPFERAWFDPHFEFRFPLIGRVAPAGVEIELRHAIEPWHVLGEEPGGGGTVRYVDSSLERLQIRARGLIGDRHVVACNGRRVPLQPTGTREEGVAGVRYRAWRPASALHPTIPVHAPLVIDLVDLHAGRSLGGCTYHVAHPSGRNYETFPVNAHEAEARRGARFAPFGHTPGTMRIPPLEPNPEFPHTLDLRRPAP
jgi:uncharacterized protein (DUF2126 family)